MNEKIGTSVSSEKENVKESQSRSVTPSLDTPSGAGLEASQSLCFILEFLLDFWKDNLMILMMKFLFPYQRSILPC